METEILSPDELARAVAWLRQGEPVAIPTETVYGLAAPLFDVRAVERIFEAKQRPSDNPLIAHVASIEMVEALAERIPASFYALARKFWPGPLTIVLPKRPSVPDLVSAGHPTIAVRMPSHPIARALIAEVGPLVAPSANLSGRPSPTCVAHVLEDLSGRIAAVIDGGEASVGIESTVLSLVHAAPTLLRPGSITREALEAILRCKIASAQEGEPTICPGMKYRHYAPKARVRLVEDAADVRGEFVVSRWAVAHRRHRPLETKSLYAHFREADRLGVGEVWVVLDRILLNDEGLMNRLRKAAAH